MRLKSHVIEFGNRSELAVSLRSDAGRDRLLIEQRHRHVFRYIQFKFIEFGVNQLRVVQFGIIERSSRCDHLNRLADGDCWHGL